MTRVFGTITAIVLFVVAALGGATTLSAQEATPVGPGASAQQFPITPDPANCTGDQISTDELLGLWYGPDGEQVTGATPVTGMDANEVTIQLGTPADDATTAEVISVVESVFSCFAAGDAGRAFGYFSENLSVQFGPEPGTSLEEAEAFLTASPVPETEEEAGTLVAITDVSMLDDGRIGAFVVEQFAGEYTTSYAILVREGDRLLVDQVIEFTQLDEEEEGTPTS